MKKRFVYVIETKFCEYVITNLRKHADPVRRNLKFAKLKKIEVYAPPKWIGSVEFRNGVKADWVFVKNNIKKIISYYRRTN